MTFYIRTPAGTDRYSLVSDLKVMASDVESHLDNVQTSINLCVRENSSPAFNSITTASPPLFPGITLVGPRSMSSIVNNEDGFGLKSQSLKFTTTDSLSWTTTGHINVPSYGTGAQAVNATTVLQMLAERDARIASLETKVAALENTRATKTYVDSQDTALSGRITTAQNTANLVDDKANWWKAGVPHGANRDWAPAANWANVAGSAGTATNAGNANALAGRRWNMGVHPVGSVSASGLYPSNSNADNITVDIYIPHGLGASLAAAVVTPAGETGQQSIVCSIAGWDASHIWVKVRNLNKDAAESCTLSWVAIA